MKNITLLIILFVTGNIFAQSDYVVINHAGGTQKYIVSDVTNITFESHNCGESFDYEGQTYNTILIGDQCWMKENLNVGTKITGTSDQADNLTIEKYCYDDDDANCATYGGLYQWNEAMQYVTSTGSQGICPLGWHIPTYTELQILGTAVSNSSNALKSVGQGSGLGSGNNDSGFSALLAGIRDDLIGSFFSLGYGTYFWSSTEGSSSSAYYMYMSLNNDNVSFNSLNKVDGFSVRCVKD